MGIGKDRTVAFGIGVETPADMTTGQFTSMLDEKLAGLNTTYLTSGPASIRKDDDRDVYLVITDTVREVPYNQGAGIVRSDDECGWARDLSRLVAELGLRTLVPNLTATWLILVDES